MKFSERMGYTQPLPFQTDSMSEGLKNDIINLYCQIYQIKCDEANDFYNLDADKFNNDIWEKFFHNISGYTDIKIIIAQGKFYN